MLLDSAFSYAAANYTVIQSRVININEWSICKRVVNNAGKDIFIPTKTQAEWQSFIGNVPSGVSLTYCAPSAPPTLTVTRQGTQALLSWSSPSADYGSAITSYKIYRGTASGSETFLTSVGNVQSYTDSGIAANLNYYYKVAAVNGGGEGDLSQTAQISSCDPNVITSYGSWGSCSTTCGGGTQSRTNTNQCGSSVTETQSCNTQPCCDSNIMSSCGSWSGCSTTCGTGSQTRTCNNQCGSAFTQSQGCTDNTGSSTISSCGGWGSCSTTCGWGAQYRTCYYVCGGSTQQSQGCYDGSRIGQVSGCSGWGGCSASCGGGTQSRTCYYTCGGSYSEPQNCNTQTCVEVCGDLIDNNGDGQINEGCPLTFTRFGGPDAFDVGQDTTYDFGRQIVARIAHVSVGCNDGERGDFRITLDDGWSIVENAGCDQSNCGTVAGCGTEIIIPGGRVTRTLKLRMLNGGGDDQHISFTCCGSNGWGLYWR